MTWHQVQRIAIAGGAMLADSVCIGNLDAARAFEPEFWGARGELDEVGRGRGSAWFIGPAARQWVLRHYRRGGWVARFSTDRYAWAGEARVRAFAEWRLLAALVERGLPVPMPIAARYVRTGMSYRCDLITRRIQNAEPLSVRLKRTPLSDAQWQAVGETVRRLHAAGVYHADLNAHNILIDGAGTVSVIDFDRGSLRRPGAWAARNLSRLRRSLVKVSRDGFPAGSWRHLMAGYAAL